MWPRRRGLPPPGIDGTRRPIRSESAALFEERPVLMVVAGIDEADLETGHAGSRGTGKVRPPAAARLHSTTGAQGGAEAPRWSLDISLGGGSKAERLPADLKAEWLEHVLVSCHFLPQKRDQIETGGPFRIAA